VKYPIKTITNKAVIAGGSLGGLMTGIVLEAAGMDVDIYERSPTVLGDRGAGIVMQAETETFLTQYGQLKPEQIGVWLKYRQYLSKWSIVTAHVRRSSFRF
jgi:2,6-dihydroxypyridine 3-monooxygenase